MTFCCLELYTFHHIYAPQFLTYFTWKPHYNSTYDIPNHPITRKRSKTEAARAFQQLPLSDQHERQRIVPNKRPTANDTRNVTEAANNPFPQDEFDFKSNCTCLDPFCPANQCHRGIVRVHKMGMTMLIPVATRYMPKTVETTELKVTAPHFNQQFRNTQRYWPPNNYRHIVVTRNFYDTLVSGYLYHKAHRECDLTQNGQPNYHGWLLNNSKEHWEVRINETLTKSMQPWPLGRDRDLCTYLSEESEEDGMRVYMEWVKAYYFDPLIEFTRERRQEEKLKNINHTLFYCFETFMDNFTQGLVDFCHFLFPEAPLPQQIHRYGAASYNGAYKAYYYSPTLLVAGHSTVRDPKMRRRLKDIIQRLDQKLFEGSIERTDRELFGCEDLIWKQLQEKLKEEENMTKIEGVKNITVNKGLNGDNMQGKLATATDEVIGNGNQAETWKITETVQTYPKQYRIEEGQLTKVITTVKKKKHTVGNDQIMQMVRDRRTEIPASRYPPQLIDSNCTCADPYCSGRSCHRGIVRVHKMGVTLLSIASVLFMFRKVDATEIKASEEADFIDRFQRHNASDYRHVVVTRNLYDALLSGYLYHKAHRECERNQDGHLFRGGWLFNNSGEDWEKRIKSVDTRSIRPWPEGLGRDLCTYLSDESEDNGLRVYVEWAKAFYLEPLVEFSSRRKEAEKRAGINKTLFSCYEDVTSNFTQSMKIFGNWMFPSAPLPVRISFFERMRRNQSDQAGRSDEFILPGQNLHATDRDPALRARLRQMIANLDHDLYNDWIQMHDKKLFGCGHYGERRQIGSSAG